MSFRRGSKLDEDDADFFDESVKRFKYGNSEASDQDFNVNAEAAHDDEVDPLDAFMAEMAQTETKSKAKPKPKKAERTDLDAEDSIDIYMQQKKKALEQIAKDPQLSQALAARGIDLAKEELLELSPDELRALILEEDRDDEHQSKNGNDSEDELDRLEEMDLDGLDLEKLRKNSKLVPPLPPVDHSTIQYEGFNKDFFEPHKEIASLDEQKIVELRKTLDVRVSGADVPPPCISFGHFGFDDALLKEIRRAGFERPTPIQAQAVPVALSGRDMIAIAKTGSGKTAAFLWPMLIHLMDQRELSKGDGPIGLVVAPTRELCDQIFQVAKQFAKAYSVKVAPIYGGMQNKFEQFKMLKGGCEIVVCTPGRLIDLLKMKATNLRRVTFLVLDEADRMFDMGFGQQVRSIVGQIRPDRQTLLFSATMKKRVERLAREILDDPIRVNIGEIGAANADVRQNVVVLNDLDAKFAWLSFNIGNFLHMPPSLLSNENSANTSSSSSPPLTPVLVFVSTKAGCEQVTNRLTALGRKAVSLHGDKAQGERAETVWKFKRGDIEVLVATDVAARGLDIKGLKTVINFDCARDIDSHTHRIGRTGRAGAQDGTAYTLLMPSENRFAGDLVNALEVANQMVTPELFEIARRNPRFRNRSRGGSNSNRPRGGGRGGGVNGYVPPRTTGIGYPTTDFHSTGSYSSSSPLPVISSSSSSANATSSYALPPIPSAASTSQLIPPPLTSAYQQPPPYSASTIPPSSSAAVDFIAAAVAGASSSSSAPSNVTSTGRVSRWGSSASSASSASASASTPSPVTQSTLSAPNVSQEVVNPYANARSAITSDYVNTIKKSFVSSFTKAAVADSTPQQYGVFYKSIPAPSNPISAPPSASAWSASTSTPTPSTSTASTTPSDSTSAAPAAPAMHPARMAMISGQSPPTPQSVAAYGSYAPPSSTPSAPLSSSYSQPSTQSSTFYGAPASGLMNFSDSSPSSDNSLGSATQPSSSTDSTGAKRKSRWG